MEAYEKKLHMFGDEPVCMCLTNSKYVKQDGGTADVEHCSRQMLRNRPRLLNCYLLSIYFDSVNVVSGVGILFLKFQQKQTRN